MTGALGLTPGGRALVVAPHLDDETLGCGGTLARLADEGVEAFVLAISVGALAQWGGTSDPAVRVEEFHQACAALDVRKAEVAWVNDARHGRLDAYQRELVTLIEHAGPLSLQSVRPDALFLPAASCFHQDHAAVHRAAFAAARAHSVGLKPTPRLVLGFVGPEDTWSAQAEPRRVHVDTSRYWQIKERALGFYASQLRGDGHPRSIEQIRALDTAAGGSLGWKTAESFVGYRLAF